MLLIGCSGRHPFLTVQLCLGDQSGVEKFIEYMREASELSQMKYIDRSEISQNELARLEVSPKYRIVNISAKDKSGTGWGASNFGLSAYEIVIGFSEGSDPEHARIFASKVIEQLQAEWDVHTVPSDRGAMPICPKE